MTQFKATKPAASKCILCGDTQMVLRGYVDPTCGMPQAMHKVPCPRCVPKSRP